MSTLSSTQEERIIELAGVPEDTPIPDLMFDPQPTYGDIEDDILLHRDGDTITIGFIDYDTSPSDFEWGEGCCYGDFQKFSRGDDREALMQEILDEGKIAFFVECYQHGNSHYSVANTKGYPDRRWDVGLAGIIIPPSEVQDRYKAILKAEGESAARAYAIKDSNGTLDEYSKWCNGEVFVKVMETIKIDGDRLVKGDYEVCGGFIGAEWAVEALKEEMPKNEEPAFEA